MLKLGRGCDLFQRPPASAPVVGRQGEGVELHCERIETKQSTGEQSTYSGDIFYDFGGLDASKYARYGTKRTGHGLIPRLHRLLSGKEAPIAG